MFLMPDCASFFCNGIQFPLHIISLSLLRCLLVCFPLTCGHFSLCVAAALRHVLTFPHSPPPTSKTPATCAVARIFQLRWLRAKTVAVPLVSRLPGCDLNRNLHRDSAAVAISPRQPQEGIVSTRQQVFWISCEPPSKMMILLRLPRTLCARKFPHQASARKADRH